MSVAVPARSRVPFAAAVLGSLVALTGCASTESSGPGAAAARGSSSPAASATAGTASVEGTVVRFRSARQTVDVTIGQDNPTVRDLLRRLPLRLTAEEFGGKEKIADVPDGLDAEGSPGSDPEDGDLIYYTPWGNLGLYYDASGVGYSDQTIHIGTYDATRQQLDRLEGPVTVSLVE